MGYFDIQVNGYAGVDFNQDDLGTDDLSRACERLRADGVDGILATIITEDVEKMVSRIRRIVELRERDKSICEMISGIHIEGPFISPCKGYRGAHPVDAIRPAEEIIAGRLLEAGDGLVRLVTLAPEADEGMRVTRFLKRNNLVIAAGHTDASLDQLRAAIDAGLSMMTHLGNGCPMHLHRHDNIIQRALFLREQLWLSFIADGVHIPFQTLRNYIDLAEIRGRALVTTDAMAAAGLGPGTHRIGRWETTVKEDLAAWAPDGSHLLGSALSMPKAAENLRCYVGLATNLIGALTSSRPRIALGLNPPKPRREPHPSSS